KTVTAVAASTSVSLALCSNSDIAGWGDGGMGQLGTGSYNYQQKTPILATRTGVLAGKTIIAIDAARDHTLALCSDGSLAAWGNNISGHLGNNSTTRSLSPVLVNTSTLASGERFVAAKAGDRHSLAIVAMPPAPVAVTLAATNVLD